MTRQAKVLVFGVGAVCIAWLGLAFPGSAPGQPTGATPKQVLVVNTQDASVSLVDLGTMKEVNRYKVGPRPYGIAVSRDGKTVAVGVEDEECVKFFSLPDFKTKGQTPIGKMHNDHIILTNDGKHILVANFYSDDVVGINVESMKEDFRIKECSAPHVVKYGPNKKYAYVTCKKVTGIAIIDPASRKLVKFHQINVNPRSLTFSPDESKVYFGSFWVNGFFEMETETGKVTRLFELEPPKVSTAPQEVTYHGVEAVYPNIVLAANEGHSCVDAMDVKTGKHLDRLTDVSKPCCIERIPGPEGEPRRVLVSNIGDGTLQLVEVGRDGKMKRHGKAQVGKAPKRVAFLPPSISLEGKGELNSGPQVGAKLPSAFHMVLTVSHPEKPDVAGKKWNYREQYGQNPVVLVFARTSGDPLTRLLRGFDAEIARYKMDNEKVHAVLVVLSDDDDLEEKLKDFGEKQGFKHVSLSIDSATGPSRWGIAKDADVTVILYNRQKVEANHVFRKGELDEKAVATVMADLSRIVMR